MNQLKIQSILFVCMGNICRSPTAEAIFRKKLSVAGIKDIRLESAGTLGFHQGSLPDFRSRKVGESRGVSFDGITARKVVAADFEKFDLILAADESNIKELMLVCPNQYQHKIHLILSYCGLDVTEVPDPYYGGDDGFDYVFELVEQSADNFIAELN
ncbi:low molecular weight phosphotyrosine protein phosphatase [Parashewanella spongiae]|uniref:protein-tyrosine-phosphatase n=1 Tax=Parashewanella spongiae TaxID=342950 RepID=A0A3A6UNN5_9GAMM|nr:low molecular weight protein-tyrosine-phosphatase [Parashewanella spongiae]MCL1078391.1 low molecular weight phosphotyrosine protein phosphatase [Parashewanella spongiae]RJY19423.1 low molecular weight phosphotyrosine protein phosphatase [Parashewanella spongiae]